MAEEKKITIEIFRKKDAEDFTKSLADPDSRAETGSGTAMSLVQPSKAVARWLRTA